MTNQIYKAKMPISIKAEKKEQLDVADFLSCAVYNHTKYKISVGQIELSAGYWDPKPTGIILPFERGGAFTARSVGGSGVAGSVTYYIDSINGTDSIDFTFYWWYVPGLNQTMLRTRDPKGLFEIYWGAGGMDYSLGIEEKKSS